MQGMALHIQSPHFGCAGDQGVIGIALVAPAADVVSPVGLVGPAFVQLIEIDHLRGAVGKADVPQGCNCLLYTSPSPRDTR